MAKPPLIDMNLPFLKNRRIPRIAVDPMEEKLVQGSADDHMHEHLLNELFDSHGAKDVKLFRQALEGLVMGMFDWDGDENEDDRK